MTPAYQFCWLQRITGYSTLVPDRVAQGNFAYREFLDQSVGLDMAMSQATTRQPSLITPLTSLLLVLDLTGKIIDFNLSINWLDTGKTNRSFQQQEKRWSTVKQVFITSGQGSAKSLLNVKSCISPTGPDWTTTTWIIVTRPDQCLEGQKMFVRLPNVPNVTHILSVGSRLNLF